MGPRVTFTLLFVAVVLAKKGGSSSHSTGGGTSSSSGPGSSPGSSSSSSSSSSDGGSAPYFIWTTSMLSEFILAIIYGVFTLVGGGYWLSKRYNPTMTAIGLKALLWSTWGNWSLSFVVYLLATCWTGRYAHWLADYIVDLLEITETSFARSALENIATAGWMFILLAHTFTVWKTPGAKIDHPSRGHILFCTMLSFLTLTSIFGGIVRPAMMRASGNTNTLAGYKIFMPYRLSLPYSRLFQLAFFG
ncbi:hypothetical protein DL96DRAFT_1740283 [Flagelloscypha sp. PMI_526]|nr:hypothetical protein DL96DRAFT_1740283 [Flagelloscypha sp. PMI_526]